MSDTLGFVGLGAMGARMAAHLLDAGRKVYVCDPSIEAAGAAVMRGAVRCETPRSVADHADIVLVCVPTPEIVEQVVLGADGLRGGERVRVVVDHSTTGPAMARRIAKALAQQGIDALDAPLAGGVAGAQAGTLSVMVGGRRAAFERCEPVFRTFGRKVVHVGAEPGMGQALKLTNNMIVGTTLVATCEAMLFAIKCGVDAQLLLDVLNASTARSYTSEAIVPQAVLARSFDFGFRMDLMRKDLRLFLAESEAVGTPTFAASIAKQFFDRAVAAGQGGADMTRVAEELEALAGARIERAA